MNIMSNNNVSQLSDESGPHGHLNYLRSDYRLQPDLSAQLLVVHYK